MAENEINFMNSFKMKLAIIIGVTHMTLGIILKGINAIYFGSVVDFLFEFIPQLLFMTCTFGYMCFCIIVKWLTDWSTKQPPQIINVFIEFVQQPEYPLYGDANGDFQLEVQKLLASKVYCLKISYLFDMYSCYALCETYLCKIEER